MLSRRAGGHNINCSCSLTSRSLNDTSSWRKRRGLCRHWHCRWQTSATDSALSGSLIKFVNRTQLPITNVFVFLSHSDSWGGSSGRTSAYHDIFALNLLSRKGDGGCQQPLMFMTLCEPHETILSCVFYGVFVSKCLYGSKRSGAIRTFMGLQKRNRNRKNWILRHAMGRSTSHPGNSGATGDSTVNNRSSETSATVPE